MTDRQKLKREIAALRNQLGHGDRIIPILDTPENRALVPDPRCGPHWPGNPTVTKVARTRRRPADGGRQVTDVAYDVYVWVSSTEWQL